VFLGDFITHIDEIIIIGVIVGEDFFSLTVDIFTFPSTFAITFFIIEWVVTEDLHVTFWTVEFSPRVFVID